MDSEPLTTGEKCENLMNIVVESRKRFGKLCVDYDQKASMMENKILHLHLETISNYRFKSKNQPEIVDDTSKDVDKFILEVIEKERRIERVKKRIKETEIVVQQLKRDVVGKKTRQPLTAEAMLKNAKAKQLQNILC